MKARQTAAGKRKNRYSFSEKRNMKINEVKKKAEALGIVPGNMKKNELIWKIQEREGNTPCFGRSNGDCPHTNCCFIDDCLRMKVLV